MKAPVQVGLALFLVLCDSSLTVGRTGSVTEADAVRLFLEESPQARLVQARAETARTAVLVGSEVTNPAVSYQVEDAAGVRDEFLTFQQELPITGRRSRLREGADAASSAASLAGEHGLRNAIAALRTSFYEVLYRDNEVGILQQSLEELDHTVEILRERERAGEGSGYDVLRAEQELAELRLGIEKARAESDAARAKFASFFDDSHMMESAVLEGDFALPESPLTPDEAVAIALEERSDLLALRQESRYQEAGLEAARRLRFPEPVLSAGWKRVEALGESDTGFTAALMVPLPLFDRGKFATAGARSASAQVDLEAEILARVIRAEVEAAVARARAAREAARRFGEAIEQRAAELRHIAQLAYDEGEKGILDLLDALRTSLRMEQQALSTRHAARRERIELERVMGKKVGP